MVLGNFLSKATQLLEKIEKADPILYAIIVVFVVALLLEIAIFLIATPSYITITQQEIKDRLLGEAKFLAVLLRKFWRQILGVFLIVLSVLIFLETLAKVSIF